MKSRAPRIGRPPAIDTKTVAKLTEAFRIDATAEEACSYAGISTATYYRKLKEDDHFREEMERSQMYPFILAKKAVMKAAEKGDAHLALKWLERRQRDRYAPPTSDAHKRSVYTLTYADAEVQKALSNAGLITRPIAPKDWAAARELAKTIKLPPPWNDDD